MCSAKEGVWIMKWPPTIKTACAACGRSFPIPTADLLALQAVCRRCGASLASAGEEHLRWYARYCREIDLFLVGYELQTAAGVDLSDGEVNAAMSLEDLSRAVASHLPPTPDRETRAAELVTKTARQVAPDLLDSADFVSRVIEQTSAWWDRRRDGRGEVGAPPDSDSSSAVRG
jgi:hypothetical protein